MSPGAAMRYIAGLPANVRAALGCLPSGLSPGSFLRVLHSGAASAGAASTVRTQPRGAVALQREAAAAAPRPTWPGGQVFARAVSG